MSDPKINIRTDLEPPGRRSVSSRKRRISPILLLSSAAIFAAIALVIFIAGRSQQAIGVASPRQGGSLDRSGVAAADSQPSAPVEPETSAEELVDDPEGELLWASPTAGPALALAYLPAGMQCLIHLHPADLAAHPEGERILAALGPWGQESVQRLQSLLGADIREVDDLLIAVVVDGRGKLDACVRAAFTSPLSENDLGVRLPNAEQNKHSEASYLTVGDRAYLVRPMTPPAAGRGNWLIVCPSALAPELIDAGDEPPPLVRDIERLVESTDADRQLSIIVAPKFLQAGGNELLVDAAAPLHAAIQSLAGADAGAILVSAHLGKDFFAEIRAAPSLNVPPRRLAAKLRERLEAAPAAIENIVLDSPWHPYGRKVLARFPGMLRALARYSRAAVVDQQAVVRAYLPASAAHNLLMGAELLLTQPRAGEAVESTATIAERSPRTIDERLDKRTSLAFAKETLERALELLAEDVGVEISINGADLQLEGITKNQSLALEMRDRQAREILLEILLRANPDRTAAGPADSKQKLIYTLPSGDSNAPGRIIVTTRAAAERRGDRLPDVFLLKNR